MSLQYYQITVVAIFSYTHWHNEKNSYTYLSISCIVNYGSLFRLLPSTILLFTEWIYKPAMRYLITSVTILTACTLVWSLKVSLPLYRYKKHWTLEAPMNPSIIPYLITLFPQHTCWQSPPWFSTFFLTCSLQFAIISSLLCPKRLPFSCSFYQFKISDTNTVKIIMYDALVFAFRPSYTLRCLYVGVYRLMSMYMSSCSFQRAL